MTVTTGFVFFKVRWHRYLRLLVSIVVVGVVWGAGLQDARPANADTGCALVKCVLACNARTKLCSRYPAGKVPRGYTIRGRAPAGFATVRGFTICDHRSCPDRAKPDDCPIGTVPGR